MNHVLRHRPRPWLALAGALALVASLLVAPAHAQTADVITGVTPVDDVTVPNGTTLEEALEQLPPTTTITVSDGDTIPVELDWALRPTVELSRGGTAEQVWYPTARGAYEFLGTFDLPDGVAQAQPAIPLEVVATVTIAGGELLTFDDTDVFDEPGTYVSESLTFGDIERTFHYYVPSSYDPSEPMPVMVTLHGAGSYGIGQMAYSEFDRVAEENGFIVVAPDYGLSAHGFFLTPGIADFTDAILDHLIAQYSVDERRIYASGISMGGGASQTLAYELSDRIAAIAPVATGITRLRDEPLPRPMTVVSFYGTNDSSWGPGFLEGIASVAEQLDADPEADITTWPATDDDPTTVVRHAHDDGRYGTEAVFYEVQEGGHTWPGTYQYASLITVGPTSQHLHATEVIWDHLQDESLPVEVPVDVVTGRVNPRSQGVIQVAVLSTDEVDTTTIETDVVRLGPSEASPERMTTRDVNRDGRNDAVLRFRIPETGLTADTDALALTGRAVDGGALFGEAEVELPGRR